MSIGTRNVALIIPILLITSSNARGNNSELALEVTAGKPMMLSGKKQTAYIKVGLAGFERETKTRSRVNLAIVLDRSSSMSGAKIKKAKDAALTVVDRLHEADIISIITYDSTVEVLVPATKVADRDYIKKRIRAIEPRGSTALYAGVSHGISQVNKFIDREQVNRVVLLSDGQANVGPRSPNELGRLGAAASKQGIAITTIGLGLGYNEDLMSQLALRSDGNHAFVENADQLATFFNYELGDVLSVVAQEISLKAKFSDGVRPVRVLNREAQIHGQEVFISFNQLYSKQERYALIEVEVPPGDAGSLRRLVDVDLSYANMATKQTDRLSRALNINFTNDMNLVAKNETRDVMVAAVEAIAAERNRMAVAIRDKGNMVEARNILRDNAMKLEKAAARYKSERLKSYSASNNDDADNLEERKWNKRRKRMRKVDQAIMQQSLW